MSDEGGSGEYRVPGILMTREQYDKDQARILELEGTLADIAFSDDLTLEDCKKKAAFHYRKGIK